MEQKIHTVVRYTTLDDLDKVLSIYDYARRRMRESGNPNQWIDTHEDNAPMLGWIRSRGFQYCGIIHCASGTPRLAFQLQNNNIHPKL